MHKEPLQRPRAVPSTPDIDISSGVVCFNTSLRSTEDIASFACGVSPSLLPQLKLVPPNISIAVKTSNALRAGHDWCKFNITICFYLGSNKM